MKYSALLLLVIGGLAHADGARIGVELEHETDRQTGIRNDAVTLIPGWEFGEHHLISRVELLMEHNKDKDADSEGVRAQENKLFVRLRHDGELTGKLGYYVRGGVGRAFNNAEPYNYGYVEPGLEYKPINHWELILSYRAKNSIDHTTGHRVGEWRLGPSFEINEHNEIELRYVRGQGDKDTRTWVLEYVYKR